MDIYIPKAMIIANVDLVEPCIISKNVFQSTVYGRIILANGPS